MLYLVATPIGNLGDISLRALDVLRSVDIVASEDTRKTGLLLKHFEIKKPQIAFYDHNEQRAARKVLEHLAMGQSVALVSNAGTPGISDPGFRVVAAAIEQGYPLTMVPGASAHTMALILSGLPVHAFAFHGFPPRTSVRRRKFFSAEAKLPHTLIYYESPHRLIATLEDALAVFGDRRAALANDLTKKFEAIERGTLSDLIARLKPTRLRGEYTLVIAGNPNAAPDEAEPDADPDDEGTGDEGDDE